MSFERQRAIEVSVESTLRARKPALARAWLVRVTSSCSSAALNELPSQARTGAGWASSPAAVSTSATEVSIDQRRSLAVEWVPTRRPVIRWRSPRADAPVVRRRPHRTGDIGTGQPARWSRRHAPQVPAAGPLDSRWSVASRAGFR